jgi:hypothetical protein
VFPSPTCPEGLDLHGCFDSCCGVRRGDWNARWEPKHNRRFPFGKLWAGIGFGQEQTQVLRLRCASLRMTTLEAGWEPTGGVIPPRSENPDLDPTDEDLSVGTPVWVTQILV